MTGYINERGTQVDEFEGCDHGRQLIVDYSYVVVRQEYSYWNAYLPTIVILTNGASARACIDDEVYRVSTQ